MSEEQNKVIVKKFIEEMWNERKLDLADELFATNCITHQLRSGEGDSGMPRSADSLRSEASAWLSGFPDLKFNLEQMIAADDRVVTCCMMRGTHTGLWMGLSPTGKQINVPIITIHRIAGSKIVEDWVLVGSLALFQQLGLVPETEAILARGKS